MNYCLVKWESYTIVSCRSDCNQWGIGSRQPSQLILGLEYNVTQLTLPIGGCDHILSDQVTFLPIAVTGHLT